MAHVHSYSQRDEDGIFLYDKNKRRIAGPYPSDEAADEASRAASRILGERPVGDYRKHLAQGLLPLEPEGLFNIDRKLSPVEQLADTEFRVQLNPQGVARYSDMYRNPSKYTGILEYQGPSDAGAVYMDEPTALSENMWGHNTKEAVNIVPGQLVEKGRSYQTTANMDIGTLQEKRDRMHHEAFHDASVAVLNSEFMPREFREAYRRFRQPGVGSILGIYIDEALAYQDQLKTASTKEYRDLAEDQLSEMRKRATDKLRAAKRDNRKDDVDMLTFWLVQLEPERLDEWNRQILHAAKKRHEALGYK